MARAPLFVEYVPKRFSADHAHVIEQVNEILETYATAGYDLTLRQVYYQFVSRAWIANKATEYKRLGSIINDARLAGLIPWNRIIDRTRNLAGIYHVDDVEQAVAETAEQFALDTWTEQPTRVEVWVEKDALVGVIGQAADKWDVAYFSCRGYTSQSELWVAALRHVRYVKAGQKVVVLHLGDHDPSGIDMSRDIRERLHLFASHHLGGRAYSQIAIRRIALNMEQVEEYDPPPNPAKLTDSRGANYVDEYGEESWELDALEPAVLEALIDDEIGGIVDMDALEARREEQETERRRLQEVSDRWTDVVDLLEGE